MRTKQARIPTWFHSLMLPIRTQWWGSIGCRISFMMSLAILLIVVTLGTFLVREGRREQQAEVRSRLLFIGSYLSSLTVDDIRDDDRNALHRKLSLPFLAEPNALSGLAYLVVYNKEGKLLATNAPQRGVLTGEQTGASWSGFDSSVLNRTGSSFEHRGSGIYEMIMPVTEGNARIGYVKIGTTSRSAQERLDEVTRNAIIVVIPVLIIGLLFSQLMAAGIVKPLLRLSAAVEDLSRQNWKSPIPVEGKDEIARLARAFNQMALTLKQRESSLSQGNRDLFVLHTAGLDLMESLDLQGLLSKIAARAEDLIRAETTAVASMDPKTIGLQYLGVAGEKGAVLAARKTPLESGGIYNWLASYGTPLLVPDATTDFRLDAAEMRAMGIRSLMAVPMWSSNRMIGILTAVNKKGGDKFDKHDLRLLTVFSNIVGAALQNAFLYGDLKDKMEELRNTQQQLIHSTKMAAIGELAANVAHEVNNPLTSVLGYTSHLIRTRGLPAESLQKLHLMEQETLRVRKIIRNLLDFARSRTSRKRVGDVVQPLQETTALLHGVAERSKVKIVEEYPDNPVQIEMDHNEMKQVFINIVNNAIHAMPQGGTLRIRVGVLSAQQVAIEFADTGTGVPDDLRQKIFQPFFSTKSEGNGTGLGLSISERIVQSHGGTIQVESSEGRGAVFLVLLPACAPSLVRQNWEAEDARGSEMLSPPDWHA
jgi:signal transduction histidine kinase